MSWPPLQERLQSLLEPGYLLYESAFGMLALSWASMRDATPEASFDETGSLHYHRLSVLHPATQFPIELKPEESARRCFLGVLD